jgi:hypothetical protein
MTLIIISASIALVVIVSVYAHRKAVIKSYKKGWNDCTDEYSQSSERIIGFNYYKEKTK